MYYIIYVNILLIILISYINIIINIYIYIYIYIYIKNIYDICNLETLCLSSYHNGFVVTYSFGHPIHMM